MRFYLRIGAHALGVLVLISLVALLGLPPLAAAIVGLVAMFWVIALFARCVAHWTRERQNA